MKKSILILIIVTLLLFSCKKSYRCQCTSTTNGITTDEYITNVNTYFKYDAEVECKQLSPTPASNTCATCTSGECHLK